MPGERLIYIVDDEDARGSLSLLLEADGFRMRTFASAPELLAAAPSLSPGVLISDIRMPEMDGPELQQRITELRFGNAEFDPLPAVRRLAPGMSSQLPAAI
jgi:two-component system, LuxR family, response regulator FixJ